MIDLDSGSVYMLTLMQTDTHETCNFKASSEIRTHQTAYLAPFTLPGRYAAVDLRPEKP